LHFARKVPSVPMQRRMRLADVIAARRTWPERLSWCSIFLKAYSIVAVNRPELRRSYMPFPRPHLYEHPSNIATFSVERLVGDEGAVFLAQVPRPEVFDLGSLDQFIRQHTTSPIEEIACFRRALRVSKLPLPIRRLAWMAALYGDGSIRAQVFGTFGISVVGSLGAAGLHLLSPLTTTLNYGTFEPDGSLDVRITYDHRVLDGAPLARAMAALEEVLHGEILTELTDGPKSVSSPQPPQSKPLLAQSFGGQRDRSANVLINETSFWKASVATNPTATPNSATVDSHIGAQPNSIPTA
jgi:hypothetical protein